MGSRPSKSRPGSIRPKTCFSPPLASRAAGVKFCQPTIDKMAIHPLGAAWNFKADDPVEAALQGAFLAAIFFAV
jgi:hypothetical protein